VSARPSSQPPVWCTDPPVPERIIVPGTTEQEEGWAPGDDPPAEYFNWWQNLAYQWLRFVADGVLAPAGTVDPVIIAVDASDRTYTRSDVGGSFLRDGFVVGQRVSFTGFANAANNSAEEGREIESVSDLIITVVDGSGLVDEAGTGNETARAWITLDANQHVTGNLRAMGDGTIEGELGVADDLTVGGASFFGDDVTIDGALTVDDQLTVTAGGATIAGDVTLGTNSDVTISGTGRYKHGDFTLVVSPAAFTPTTGSPSFSTAGEPTWTATGADVLYAAVQLPVGKRLRSISFANTRVSGTLTFEALNHDVQNGAASLVGASLPVNSGTSRVVSPVTSVSADADATIGAGEVIQLTASLGASGNKLHGAILTFDEP
jgi:hypothetical protein